jgi:hypothetical protein
MKSRDEITPGNDTGEVTKEAAKVKAPAPSLARRRPMGWFMSRTRKVMRLTAYIFVVSLIGATLLARAGYARIKGSAMNLGDELIRLTETGMTGDFYKLRLNGERMNVATAKTSLSVKEVIARFRSACETGADGIADEFAHLREVLQPGAAPQAHGYPGLGILREETEDRGMVLCFAQGGPTDHVAAFGRLTEFADTGDLGKIGDLRYVVARRTVGGSHVVAAWTKGTFPVGKMFPSEGDAPGDDVAGAVRPDGTRRLFSAYTEGVPYGIRVYEADRSASMVLDQYDREMPMKGWETLTPVGQRLPSTRAFSREGVDLLITVGPHNREAGKAVISVIEMSSR